jgi:hypothetical protein
MPTNIVFVDGTKASFEAVIEQAVSKALADKLQTDSTLNKVITINKAAKLLGMAHSTVKKLIATGAIKTVTDGKITIGAVNDYLGRK